MGYKRREGGGMLDTQILFHHTPADGVIKVLVLGKRLQGKAPVNLVQGAEQGSNKLHAADLAEQIGCVLVAGAVVGLEGDLEVGKFELHILGVEQIVDLAEKLGPFGAQGLVLLQLLKENNLLVGREGLDILGTGLVGLFIFYSVSRAVRFKNSGESRWVV